MYSGFHSNLNWSSSAWNMQFPSAGVSTWDGDSTSPISCSLAMAKGRPSSRVSNFSSGSRGSLLTDNRGRHSPRLTCKNLIRQNALKLWVNATLHFGGICECGKLKTVPWDSLPREFLLENSSWRSPPKENSSLEIPSLEIPSLENSSLENSS